MSNGFVHFEYVVSYPRELVAFPRRVTCQIALNKIKIIIIETIKILELLLSWDIHIGDED